jgi:hypothetical protein
VSSVEPSGPYQISLAGGVLGLPFLAMSLGGVFNALHGANPVDAAGWPGTPAFIGMFAVVFTARLIFWDRTPPNVKALVRLLITALMGLEVLLAALAVVLTVTDWSAFGPHYGFFIGWFTFFAALCQIGSVIWLLKYRREV